MSRDSDKKKSSGTAKTALGLAIGGLSLAAANSGILGGGGMGCNGGGGLLGGLFGGNNSACQVYDQQKMDMGLAAATELNMVSKYVMPIMGQLCDLQTKTAVNSERDAKNEIITGMMFKMSEQHANNLFERAQCCCEKNQITMSNMYDRLAAADQCNYDRLYADTQCAYNHLDEKINCTADKATMRTDATFALRKAQVDAQLAEAMCGVIKGKPYLSPTQLADPYQAGSNVLISRHMTPCASAASVNDGCCGNWAW